MPLADVGFSFVLGWIRDVVVRKPFLPCVPSQNGLLLEPPQRHSATPRTVAQASPDARRKFGTGAASASFSR